MAFSVRNLSVVAYANGFTLWHYKAPTLSLEIVMTPGFFNGAADMMCAGDMVMIFAQDGVTIKGIAGGLGDDIRLSPI